ncbi:hypothetical protein E2553_38740 [Paraburkholderia dipogonis]|uniref:Uncharacterized protein n=1 Tax=Paraburkholderia dipogonis TaxID=1211383 RepID=A0A4Y8MJ17_9BURK|nr:hypothetical protein [Paraburkholderia dipogonis]TFE37418.1 hypothetical protein E2553_38740 [Paraburkholderia dipogonis]
MLEDLVTIKGHVPNVWKAATRLSSFKELLGEHCRSMSSAYGVSVETDDRALASAFFIWAQTIENHRHYLQQNAPDYFQFLVGRLLAELLKAHAVNAVPRVDDVASPTEDNSIAKWWPTGFILTIFLIELVRKVILQECDRIVCPSDKLANIKVWQSFRENLLEEPSIAVAYFDDFMRIVPNWRNPSAVCERNARAVRYDKPPGNLD